MENDTILVEIAAYREKELLNTVNSALIQADNPERISFSICYQNDDLSDYEELKKIKNCKVKLVKEKDAKGCCYARYLCQKMLDDEKYVYQIDSHMRFVKHWDTKMIEQLLSLNDENAIISFYPSNCTEDMMKLPLDDKIFDEPTSGGFMYADGFRNDSKTFVELKGEEVSNEDGFTYRKCAFIAGGNFFSFAKVHKEVLNDPDMYFYADELAMSIRLFTYGYNIYGTSIGYIYHQYERPDRYFPSIPNIMPKEDNRFSNLVKVSDDHIDFKEFGLGNKRTLEEYLQFAGIDFKNKIIYLTAETGDLDNPKYIGKISYFMQKQQEEMVYQKNIDVLVVDVLDDYQKCIDSCLSKAMYKDKINFIIGSTKLIELTDEEKKKKHIKKYLYLKDANYSEIINKISSYIGDGYAMVVDSSVRFIGGWDNYLSGYIGRCGENTVLTSWVWKTDEQTASTMFVYNNIPKKYHDFYNYLPVISYGEEMDVMKYPYQTGYISDGFLFCYADILKKVPFDPKLDYEEQKYIYAIRLWTNGINIYYPPSSYMVRVQEDHLLSADIQNLDVVCALSGIKNYYSKRLESNYPYDIGKERAIFSWYQFLNIDYDINKKTIIEKNKD